MTERIADGLPSVTQHLVFSADGRYLAATLNSGGLRVFDRDKKWAEAFRDTEYGSNSYGAVFANDGRLAVSAYDGKIRLYDRNFKLMVHPRETPSGHRPRGLLFSPDGNVLAVGYNDTPSVDLLDGHNLAPLSGPSTDDLHN